MKKLLLLCVLTLGCSDDSSGDAGSDATIDTGPDLCDISSFTGNGNACPRVSTRVCFSDPTCEAGTNGCTCQSSNGTPKWNCYTPPECLFPCSSSPFVDAACDAGDDGEVVVEAGDDSSSSDAGADASDAGTD